MSTLGIDQTEPGDRSSILAALAAGGDHPLHFRQGKGHTKAKRSKFTFSHQLKNLPKADV